MMHAPRPTSGAKRPRHDARVYINQNRRVMDVKFGDEDYPTRAATLQEGEAQRPGTWEAPEDNAPMPTWVGDLHNTTDPARFSTQHLRFDLDKLKMHIATVVDVRTKKMHDWAHARWNESVQLRGGMVDMQARWNKAEERLTHRCNALAADVIAQPVRKELADAHAALSMAHASINEQQEEILKLTRMVEALQLSVSESRDLIDQHHTLRHDEAELNKGHWSTCTTDIKQIRAQLRNDMTDFQSPTLASLLGSSFQSPPAVARTDGPSHHPDTGMTRRGSDSLFDGVAMPSISGATQDEE